VTKKAFYIHLVRFIWFKAHTCHPLTEIPILV